MNAGPTGTSTSAGVPTTGVADRALPAQIAAWLAHLRIERGLAENTLRGYARDLARYDAFLAARDVADVAAIRQGDVTEFVATLREAATVGRRCRPPRPPAPSRRSGGSTASASSRGPWGRTWPPRCPRRRRRVGFPRR